MNKLSLLFFLLVLITACKSSKNTTSLEDFLSNNDTLLDEIIIEGEKDPYRASYLRLHDLIHTKLDVRFDREQQHLIGDATLTLKPYFYKTNTLVLDAKGMDINKVQLTNGTPLEYSYDNKQINITLDKIYTREDVFDIYISYVSKPNELEKTSGLEAITDDKGLYFINPTGEKENYPIQIWTQGEPESNSVWFPTIDKPNERCTQEISITVENEYIAMSNGRLISDVNNQDGTHTVTWRQDKPHAPYLFMMAIGDFAQVKDSWNGLSVDYFVEHEYKDVAKKIFGKTPEMMTFFTSVLGVDYEWDKYWQVIVREYVSGAMENTSAVIFGDFVQQTEKELNDDLFTEDIVAHELFHHWFGDLVTCESWANLPLNESFATYGEVLWREHKYGEDEKYRKLLDDKNSYMNEVSRGKQVDLIRYRHDTAEDMFDSHSYAKGGYILNMLREWVGDEAFFASLKKYLEDNKFEAVEIHNLRLAFEEITGQDLNWFFNQWFLSAGHPIIDVNYSYTDSNVIINMTQEPSAENNLVYKLPMAIDIHLANGEVLKKHIIFDESEQEFKFETPDKALWVNVDATKTTLAQINYNQTKRHWLAQYDLANNMQTKYDALTYFEEEEPLTEEASKRIIDAINDEYWFIQEKSLSIVNPLILTKNDLGIIEKLAKESENSAVRAEALYALGVLKNADHENIFIKALEANSYNVNAAALSCLSEIKPEKALEKAETLEADDNYALVDALGYVYSSYGEADKATYFKHKMKSSDDKYIKLYATYYYSLFLTRMEPKIALEGINDIVAYTKAADNYSHNVGLSSLNRIMVSFEELANGLQAEIKDKSLSNSQKIALENEMLEYKHVAERAEAELMKLKN